MVDLVVGCPYVCVCDFELDQLDYWFLCSLLMYVCRYMPVWVPIGAPLSQYGVVWAICILGM